MTKQVLIGILLSSLLYSLYYFLFHVLEITHSHSPYNAEYTTIIEARPGLESMLIYNDTLVMS